MNKVGFQEHCQVILQKENKNKKIIEIGMENKKEQAIKKLQVTIEICKSLILTLKKEGCNGN